MQAQIRTTPARLAAPGHGLLSRFLDRLVAADARFRAAARLRDMPDEQLTDMGLTRADVDAHFDHRLGTRKLPQWPTQGW